MLYNAVKALVLPPLAFFVVFFVGLIVMKWRPRLGRTVLWALLTVVYLTTTPFLAGELMAPLQPYQALDLEDLDQDVEAIIVLSAGVYHEPPEYQRTDASFGNIDTAGSMTLQRLQYAAFLSKASGKQILVTGGPTRQGGERTIAEAMKRTLEEDFGVPVRWAEDRSVTTWSNATNSSAILRRDGIGRAYLVTHAWHMPRALIAFESTGLAIVPAPTRFFSRSEATLKDFIPSARAVVANYYALHEWLGLVWYWLRQ